MSDNSFTEVTEEGWFSRLGGAFKGILTGLALIPIAVVLLWWNEGRSVKTMKTNAFAKDSAIAVSKDQVKAENQGKLIHVNGKAETTATLTDNVFGISQPNAIRLIRTVEVYQWKEEEKTTKKKKTGGSTQKTTTYDYKKIWSDRKIDSSDFKYQEKKNNDGTILSYMNPTTWKYESQDFTAQTVTLGKFNLPKELIVKVPKKTAINNPSLPSSIRDIQKTANGFIISKNSQYPQIGDYRITFQVVKPQNISVMAKQEGATFAPFQTPFKPFFRLDAGLLGIEGMIAQADAENSMLTWILRFVGWLLMFIGIGLILKPLSVLGDIIPFIGSMIEVGNSIVSFLIATPLALTVIALAWIAYRPLLGIPLLILSGYLIFVLFKKVKQKKNATA